MAGWRAFKEGLVRSLRYWPALVLIFLALSASAFILALLPGLGTLPTAYYRPFTEISGGLKAWMLVDMLSQATHPDLLQTGIFQAAIIPWLVAVLFMPVLSSILIAFLLGGTLLTYFEAPSTFQWRRYWWGCWHWWGSFLLLGLIQAFVFLVVFLPLAIAGLTLSASQPWLALVILLALGLLFITGLALGELARAFAVARMERNIFTLLWLGLGALFRRPVALMGLYLPALLLLGGLHLVFRMGLLPLLSPEIWVLFFFATQAFILLRWWGWLVRLAGVVNLARWM